MTEESKAALLPKSELAAWTRLGIVAGFAACIVYPIMILIPLPRITQLIFGASFGPALVIASVALGYVLQARRRTPTIQLAAVFNSLAGCLVTAMIVVQLAINYSTVPVADEHLNTLFRQRVWDVVLGLDVSFDVFIGLATFFFAINMIRDTRFGRIIGWSGVFVSIVPLLGANIYFFPDPPYTHGFPHVGIFTGSWYLAVVILLVRNVIKNKTALA